jgi:hypothetical protein
MQLYTNLDLSGVEADNHKLVPRMNLENFKIKLDSNDVEITISDSIVAWACNLFIYFFKSSILPGIVHQMETAVPKDLNSDVNTFMKETQGLLDTGFYGMGLDFSYASPPAISKDHLQLFMNGTIYDYAKGETVSSDGFAVMSVDETTKEAIQMGVSGQMVDSLASFMHTSDVFDITVNQTHVSLAGVNITLDTDTMENALPGMIDRYGHNEPVEFRINTYTPP